MLDAFGLAEKRLFWPAAGAASVRLNAVLVVAGSGEVVAVGVALLSVVNWNGLQKEERKVSVGRWRAEIVSQS